MRPGLAGRVFAIGLAAALVITCAGGFVLRANLHAIVEKGFAQRLDERAERVVARLSRAADGRLVHDEMRANDDFSRIYSGWYWFADDNGTRLRSRSLWDGDIGDESPSSNDTSILRALGPGGEALIGIERSLRIGDGRVVLHAFGPAAEISREFDRIDHLLLVTLGVLLATLAAMAVMQVRVGLRPLARLRAALAMVESGTRDRVGSGYGTDLDPLARELDGLLARNARVVARARSHAADLAHALKKPLALLALEGDATNRPDRGLVSAQAQAMNALIERHLARAGSGAGERRRIDVGARIEAMLALMMRLHAGRHLHWEFKPERPVHWRGDATDLEEMLGNLLDNAGKWARSRIDVHLGIQDGQCRIAIDDDGAGLSDAQIARAMRRGQRFDETVDGSGLGLAIVADIAETYDGSLVLIRREPTGLRAQVLLPL